MSMLFKRIKDWDTSITSFRTGDVLAVDGPLGTAKMATGDLLKETAENAQRTKTVLSNGSCGNTGNAYAVVTWNVIPTNGADYIRVAMNVPLDEGETYQIEYCFFTVDSGVVPSNATGAVPSAQRTSTTYVNSTDGTLDIKVPDGYIGIGFSFRKDVGGSPVSIQDATHKNGATYSNLYLPTEVLEKFEQVDKRLDDVPFVQTILSNGSCNNTGNAYWITTYNVIPTNGADHIRLTMNVPPGAHETYSIQYRFFTVDSGIAIGNAPGAVPAEQRTAVTYVYGNNGTLDIEIPDGYIGIGFAWCKQLNGSDVSIQSDTYRNGAYITRMDVPTQVIERVSKLPIVDTILSNGSCGNTGNAYAVVTWNVIPTNGADYIRIKMTQPLPEGYTYRIQYCFFTVDSGVVPSNATGAVPSAQRTGITYVGGTDGTLDIKVPDGYIGIGFAWTMRDQSDVDVSIQDDSHRNGAYFIRICAYSQVNDDNAYSRNKERAIALNAACNRSLTGNDSKNFQLLIITDVHDDYVAQDNAINMSNNFDSIACMVHCGDEMASFYNIATSSSNNAGYLNSLKGTQKPFYFAIGNHEAGTFNFIQYCPTSAMMYNSFIKPLVDKGFIANGEYEVNKCYYYHDFNTYKIRLIVLNEYDSPLQVDDTNWDTIAYDSSLANIAWNTSYSVGDRVNVDGYTDYSFECKNNLTTPVDIYHNPNDVMPKYKLTPGYRYIGQAQAQWFLDTLESTPENYGVIVLMHNPFSDLAVVQNKKFSQPNDVGKLGSVFSQNNMVTDFIADAVNAFMTKDASYSQTVTMKDGSNYLVSKDFSSVANGVKFECFIGGHSHRDLIWRHPTYIDQWQVSPVCANTINYNQSTGSDIRRTTYNGYSKDSVTCAAFNNHILSLTKLGVNLTNSMEPRDFEWIVMRNP